MRDYTLRAVFAIIAGTSVYLHVSHGDAYNLGVAVTAGLMALAPWSVFNQKGSNDAT